MILTCFFHQTLNQYFSYIRNKEKKFRKIWPLKVYSNLKNRNWREADQLAIYKSSREVELGATENSIR